jgi:hypothetical protein
MRRLVLWFVLAFAVPAYAQATQSPPATQLPQAPLTENPDAKQSDWKGPSGFWTNPHPAKGGAYRWRMMAVGAVFLMGTAYLMWRLVKKANHDRDGR